MIPREERSSDRGESNITFAGTFGAFRFHWFRWLWLGRAASGAAFRMRNVVRGWLVYNLTGSALALSLVGASWGAATFLFSLVGGTASDRVSKRKLLVLCQAACGIIPLGVAVLIFSGMIQVWHLAVSTFILGAMFSFVIPAREALITELSPRKALMNVMALNTVGMALMGIVFSSLGGLLVEKLGSGVVYAIVALFFGISAWTFLRLPAPEQRKRENNSIGSELIDGGRYMLQQPELLGMMALELGRVLLYQPYATLLPVFAADVFDTGALGLGGLGGASALGGLLSALTVASLGDIRRKGWLLLGAGILSGVGLILLGQAPSYALAMACLLVITFAGNAYMVIRSALMQSVASPRMRGRMVGFRRLIFGLAPLGTLPIGALADAVGAPLTVTLEGIAVIALFILATLFQPRLRDMQ